MARLGLRSKLSFALVLLALIPLAVATVILVRINLWRLEISAKEYRLSVADSAILTARQMVSETRTELSTLGSILSRAGKSLEERKKLAQDWVKGTRFVHLGGVFNRSGRRALTLRADSAPKTLKPPDTLPGPVLARAMKDGVAFPLFKSTAGKPTYMPIVVPMYRSKPRKLYGFLWSGLELGLLRKSLVKLSRKRFARRSDCVFVVDRKFRVIVHADPRRLGTAAAAPLRASGIQLGRHRVGMSVEYTEQGERFLAALEAMPSLAWGVVVRQPQREAYATVRHTWQIALAVGLAFALLAIGVGILLGRRMASPILSMAGAAGRVAEGDFEVRVEVKSKDELGEMAGAFNKMAEDLQGYRQQIVEETRVRTDLTRFLDTNLVERIVSNESDLELGGERQPVTVMFADVVSFTPLTEKHDPQLVVGVLNELFTFITEIIFKHGGTIDKFMGDCVMAVFGAPYPEEDDPIRAVEAADEIMRWLEVGNARWIKDLGAELQLGIGINSGEAVVGNIGSKKRMEYTVIGNTVNVAARLEGLARPGQILLSRTTMEQLEGEFECASLGEHQLAGLTEQIEVFTVVD